MSTAEQKVKPTLARKLRAKGVKNSLKRETELNAEIEKSGNVDDAYGQKDAKLKKAMAKSKIKEEDIKDNIEIKKVRSVTRKNNFAEVTKNVLTKVEPSTSKGVSNIKLKDENLSEITSKKKTQTKVKPSTSLEALKIKQEVEDVTKATTKKKTSTATTVAKDDQITPMEIKEEHANNWEPNNWHQILENIRTMRSEDNAPVDTMGCHKCADENADEKTQRFHKLVALMLSSQTKDETTFHAMLRLREHTLTPEVIYEMKANVLEKILHPVSFYKNKAKYLQQTSKILIDKFNSDIPDNIKELVSLPGVGPKMAHICMATAWHQTTGIGVDVHVHRICNRLRWVPRPTKEPEQTRVALESWLPQELWKEVNHLLVGFGQTTCTPLRPKCSDCLNCDICPAAPKTKKPQEKRENIEVENICDKAKFKKKKMHL